MNAKLERVLIALSDNLADKNVNSACCWYLYQTKIPDKLKKKYKK